MSNNNSNTNLDITLAFLCAAVAFFFGIIMGHEVTMMKIDKDVVITEKYYQARLSDCHNVITSRGNQ